MFHPTIFPRIISENWPTICYIGNKITFEKFFFLEGTMKRFFILFVLLFVQAQSYADVSQSRLQTIADRIHVLGTKCITFWKKHGPDTVYGGFLGTMDKNGNKTTPTDKGIVQEARHLWAFSTYYQRREQSDSIKAIADNLYNFIIKYFRNPATGRFYTTVTEQGAIKDANSQLYMDGFTIYALSQYSMAFKKPEAADYALKCFLALDKARHDAQYGGYTETAEPNFLQYGGVKETNTQMHLMETFTTLYEATKDSLVKARLLEMVNIMITKVKQPQGYNNLEFSANWTPVAPATVSYGHDLEAAWLLMEAARVLGRMQDSAIIATSTSLGTFSGAKGWHAAMGGYYTQGPVAGNPTTLTKVWWIQAEAMEGLWWTYKFTKDTIHLNRLEGTLNWIEKYQLSPAAGEWYNTCNADGTVNGTTNMGDAWKASYHSMRSLMFTEDWIRGSLLTGSMTNRQYIPSNPVSVLISGQCIRIRNNTAFGAMIEIVDALGTTLKRIDCNASKEVLWKTAAKGVYFVNVSAGENVRYTNRIVLPGDKILKK